MVLVEFARPGRIPLLDTLWVCIAALSSPLLSIIIPAHNEESRLPRTLEQVFGFLEQQPYAAEVVVVENGSTDRTLEIARGFAAHHPQLRVMHSDGRGKGLAVRLGMLAAAGEYRFMCDADLSMPIEEVKRFLPPALPDLDVAIGSREVPGARRYNEPMHRHLGGRFINLLIRMLILPGLQDTQCGFKCFRRRGRAGPVPTSDAERMVVRYRAAAISPIAEATAWSKCRSTGTIARKARSALCRMPCA